jgi:AcrR family transcriptional regulator
MSRERGDGRQAGRKAVARLVEEEIVRAAAVCFGRVGYHATTLDTIAARVGVSKVTLYRYVSSKEELLWRVFERTIEAFHGGLEAIVRQGLPPDETLRRIVHHQVRMLTTHLPFLAVFFSEESGLPAQLAQRVARTKREYDRTIESVVRRGIRQGIVRDLNPIILVFTILGACNWLSKWYRPDGRLAPDRIADVFVTLLERGYLREPRGGEAAAPALRTIERRVAALERLARPGAARPARIEKGRDAERTRRQIARGSRAPRQGRP